MQKRSINGFFDPSRKIKLVSQETTQECGLACVAMILGYFKSELDLSSLREDHQIGSTGLTLRDMVDLGKRFDLALRPVSLQLNDLADINVPCILHWDLNHYVVFANRTHRSFIIFDPGRGRLKVSWDEMSRHFTGIALEVSTTTEFRPIRQRNTISIREILNTISGIHRSLLFLFIFTLTLEAVSLVFPMINKVVIDDVLSTGDHELLIDIVSCYIILIIVQFFTTVSRSYLLVNVGNQLSAQWNSILFSHLLRLPVQFFKLRRLGDIISKFNTINSIQQGITTDIIQGMIDGLMAVGMFLMLSLYGGYLSIFVLVSTAADLIIRILTYRSYRSASSGALTQDAANQSLFIENIRNIETVKSQNISNIMKDKWIDGIISNINIHTKTKRLDVLFRSSSSVLFGLDKVILLYLGAISVLTGSMSVGTFIAFLSYKDQFSSRLGSLVDASFKLRLLNLQTSRLSDILTTKPELIPTTKSRNPATPWSFSLLEIENVSYRFSEGSPWILRNVSLSIRVNESIAITGQSGCGKTTLLKIIMGLLRPTLGRVLLDGVDVNSRPISEYRVNTGVVLQEDSLFSGSIRQNISNFCNKYNEEKIEQSARKMHIYDDIQKLPLRFDSRINDVGSMLSGGQRQRILLARAIYECPKLIFLDEATSNLDEITERKVLNSLAEMQCTKVIVTHRESTLCICDRLFSLDSRGISEIRNQKLYKTQILPQ